MERTFAAERAAQARAVAQASNRHFSWLSTYPADKIRMNMRNCSGASAALLGDQPQDEHLKGLLHRRPRPASQPTVSRGL